MDISVFDNKYVRIRDIYGETFSGLAHYETYEFLECEWGGEEDGIFIEDVLIYNSQIESIEEIIPHGTAELWTDNLVLRRYRMDDAEQLHEYLGKDPDMYKYSGWNPYATPEMTRKTVQRFIESYEDEHSYSWVMDANGDDVVAGTIGAYDYEDDHIEVGFSVVKGWQGRGFATEALNKVLRYLTENERIPCVTAWCASENISSRRVLEKSGMQLVRTEQGGLTVGDRTYDKLIFEYRSKLMLNNKFEPCEEDSFHLSSGEVKVLEDRIEITTAPHTDLWQRTYYHFRNDNAPVLQMGTDEKFFSFVVRTDFTGSHHRFDQCGVAMYLDSENWLKASVEYENEDFQHLGSVVTNHGYSDWATTAIPADVKTMWYRLSRREDDYCIECSQDGEIFTQMRICHMHEGAGRIRFGIYACSPEDSQFTAVFTDMKLTECMWKAHDGQQPD